MERVAGSLSNRGSGPRQLRVQAGALTFAALAWGPDDGPLALCLHGYPDTALTWRHVGPRLAAGGWRVVAPYLRGYPPSDLAPDGNYQLGALVRDAIALRSALGGDARSVLIGHDWGAAVAHLVAAGPEVHFTRVVALAIPPPRQLAAVLHPGNPRLLLRQLSLSWYMLFQQIPGLSEWALPWLIPRLWRRWSPGYDGAADVAETLACLASPAARTAALRYYRALVVPWMRRRRYSSEQKLLLRGPRVPTLVIHGDGDGCVSPETARRAGALIRAPARFVMLEGAGHFLQLERPEAVAELIEGFVRSEV